MKNPCKGCEERHQGCHAGCEKYSEWKEAHEAEKQERLKAKRLAEIPDSVHAESVERVRRRTRKK